MRGLPPSNDASQATRRARKQAWQRRRAPLETL
jgi:hypothetical protein